MSSTQSIIVYHNPAQQAFWEGGYLIPIGGSLLAGMLLFIGLLTLAERFLGNSRVNWFIMLASATASVSLAVLVFGWLFI